ncbi:hypothetical protein ONR49_26095, partial [Salmonella enterica subsp. enterica serovar Virginia]|nr:hypothetical protein [Salmonella enterica subsp. enterica serovar Virginia]
AHCDAVLSGYLGSAEQGEHILGIVRQVKAANPQAKYFCDPVMESAVHSFCHALPERWHLMSVMLSAASCLDWAAKLTGQENVPA